MKEGVMAKLGWSVDDCLKSFGNNGKAKLPDGGGVFPVILKKRKLQIAAGDVSQMNYVGNKPVQTRRARKQVYFRLKPPCIVFVARAKADGTMYKGQRHAFCALEGMNGTERRRVVEPRARDRVKKPKEEEETFDEVVEDSEAELDAKAKKAFARCVTRELRGMNFSSEEVSRVFKAAGPGAAIEGVNWACKLEKLFLKNAVAAEWTGASRVSLLTAEFIVEGLLEKDSAWVPYMLDLLGLPSLPESNNSVRRVLMAALEAIRIGLPPS